MKREHVAEMKRRRRNIALTVAYDGTDYHGFQRQEKPVIAVANVLEKKLRELTGEYIELSAAGRTDAGVHARGQVVSFFTDSAIPVERIPQAINGLLPPDIVATAAREVDRDFSALHTAGRKTYRYQVLEAACPDPFRARYSWHVGRELDLAAMREALTRLVGAHDFSAFRAAGSTERNPVRDMDIAAVERHDDMVIFFFRADGFLYHMVRNIVGTIVDVGRGRKTPAAVAEILAAKDRGKAGATAPAAGLCLWEVEYPR